MRPWLALHHRETHTPAIAARVPGWAIVRQGSLPEAIEGATKVLEDLEALMGARRCGAEEDDEDEGEQDDAAQEERRSSHAQAGPAGVPDQAPGHFYAQAPDGTRFSAGSFGDLHLSRPLQKACAALGYTHPTPIQVPAQAPQLRLRGLPASELSLWSSAYPQQG